MVYMDRTVHKEVKEHQATRLTDHEVLMVYREEAEEEGELEEEPKGGASQGPLRVARSLVRGPCIHMPKNATEWVHQFTWHGSTSSDPDAAARKSRDSLKFTKLRICPDQTCYDVEGVRTRDDALVTVKLMIFFRLRDINVMLRETHDPVADFINAVSSDVIDFVAGKSFEEFKLATEQLNELSVYRQLTSMSEGIGYEVTKVVFRGYGAPQWLQKMHDEAIDRRTKLVLERETEQQEQELHDMRQEKEEKRAKRRRQFEVDKEFHKRELQRAVHEARRTERSEEQHLQLEHLVGLKPDLGVSGDNLASYLLALEQGPPANIVQIVGKEAASGGFIHLQETS